MTGTPSDAYQYDTYFTGPSVPTNNVSWYEAALQPIRGDFAEIMRNFLEGKPARQRLFEMPEKAVDLLRTDLQAAGIPYCDANNHYADFHALRHTFITRLVNAGVLPGTAQKLARHSTITLTMDIYTHVLVTDQRDALNKLPTLNSQPSSDQRKTA